ncbi:WYL domain-containing protein [Nonomuraea aurantiaca]|uniref:WYL domain-containing protein n=1 Tax=Nonomuraea aurantiaca TaxID=2878562 RepID=UPI001CD9E8D2|nr:WYL domain-containing protein [Nonomuraea aurantiaca]
MDRHVGQDVVARQPADVLTPGGVRVELPGESTRPQYLVGWDVDRRDRRTYRADRLRLRTPNGPRCTPREPPGGDVAAWVGHRLGRAPPGSSTAWVTTWGRSRRVLLYAPADQVAGRTVGVVEPVGDDTGSGGASPPSRISFCDVSVLHA